MLRKAIIGLASLIGLLLIFTAFYSHQEQASAGSGDNLSGYAWSSNIGWISFNCTNDGSCGASDYGVRVDAAGNISGYAWSSNIGWISFNESTGCPAGSCSPTLDKAAGEVNGWARALSHGGGWDGWISLNCSNTGTCGISDYKVAVNAGIPCVWSGWAWGDDVIGWISFSGSNYQVQGNDVNACAVQLPAADIKANGSDGPVTISCNSAATITWTSANTDTCSIPELGATGTSGSQSTGNLTTSTTYNLLCTGPGGTANDAVTVNVDACPVPPPTPTPPTPDRREILP